MTQSFTSGFDSFDLSILDIMQHDNTVSQREIAKAVNLSAPAIQRRVQRLRESGVIRAEVAILDAKLLGRPLTLTVGVGVHDEHPQVTEGLLRRIMIEPAVQQCYIVTGEADFLLVITATTMSDFENITHRLFDDDDNIRRIQTSVALRCVKSGFHIPL